MADHTKARIQPTRLNVGSGDMPIPGWVNYDNSMTVRLARFPLLVKLMRKIGFLSPKQERFVSIIRQSGIRYADVVGHIPEPDGSVEVLYTCHMLEHLDRHEARQFLTESRRVLIPGGIIRIVVPDLQHHVRTYIQHGDANTFMVNLMVSSRKPRSLISKIKYLLVGDRHHLWMYDGPSLCRLLNEVGFVNVKAFQPGETSIVDPGQLDLTERAEESIYVEANNP